MAAIVKKSILFILLTLLVWGNNQQTDRSSAEMDKKNNQPDTATFGGGCFWCVEAVFERVEGILSVTSGYSGGTEENPTYEEVSSGTTGHAEVVQLIFDPAIISYADILEIFWQTHDPTTLNRQGADVGPQYRSIILYHNEEQKQIAESYKNQLDESGVFSKPIVTEIQPFKRFYSAEKYHQNYYENNQRQPYCSFVIAPKIQKFRKKFKKYLKKQ